MSGKIQTNQERMAEVSASFAGISENLNTTWLNLYSKDFAVLQEWDGDAKDVFMVVASECEMAIQEAAQKAIMVSKAMEETAENRNVVDEAAAGGAGVRMEVTTLHY